MEFKTLEELFADKSRWTSGAWARDKNGEGLFSSCPDAVSWCLLGGMNKVYGVNTEKSRTVCEKLYFEIIPSYITLIDYNDKYGYEKVLELVKKAKV